MIMLASFVRHFFSVPGRVLAGIMAFGSGGYGMLIPGRDYDQWGIGWGGTYISIKRHTILYYGYKSPA
jgi:hypothetical protein